jgi:hypothetical protein
MYQSSLSQENNFAGGRGGGTISPDGPSLQERPTPQERPKAVLLVGDPGLGQHNVGRNFDRAAASRKAQLERAGFNVVSQRVSSVNDINNALTRNGNLDRVEYFGHSSPIALFVGERSDPGANLVKSNLNTLSNAKLNRGAVIALNSCNAGRGNNSIATDLAKHLNRTVQAYDGPTRFSTDPTRSDGRSRPPESGPIYMVPQSSATNVRTFEPSRLPPPRSPHLR